MNLESETQGIPVNLSAKDILYQVKTDYNIGNAWLIIAKQIDRKVLKIMEKNKTFLI